MSALPPQRRDTGKRDMEVAKQNGGFFWGQNVVIEKIFSEAGPGAGSAILIYVALLKLSSENQNATTFTASKADIAKRCAVSESTVKVKIRDLERIGVIKVRRHPNNVIHEDTIPNTYTIILFPRNQVGAG